MGRKTFLREGHGGKGRRYALKQNMVEQIGSRKVQKKVENLCSVTDHCWHLLRPFQRRVVVEVVDGGNAADQLHLTISGKESQVRIYSTNLDN